MGPLAQRSALNTIPLARCLLNMALVATCSPFAEAADAAPLSLKTSGAVAGVVVRVPQADSYSVRLDYFYPATDLAARTAVWDGAGGRRQNAAGEWTEPGAPFNVFLRIYDIDDAVVIQDRRISHPALTSWDTGVLHAELSEVRLQRGRYQVTVERRGNAGALSEARAGISVISAY